MHIRYVIPPFQRPYVWEEEKQWQPLWEDIARTAELLLDAMTAGSVALDEVPVHFLGAVVLQHGATGTGYIRSCNVVDGQQRLTTLQVMMDAVQEVVAKHGDETDAEALQDLVRNNPKKRQHDDEIFKVWPSRLDQNAFRAVMTDSAEVPDALAEARIVQAHRYFRERAVEWAEVAAGEAVSEHRLSALTQVLHRYLQMVAIDLTATDNPQVIFETLNDRGTPLLAADLVKNFVFLAAERVGADVDEWEPEYWGEFDDPWWKEDVAQGRYFRPRIDLFLHYWLTMQLQVEVPSDEVFRRFQEFARRNGVDDLDGARRLLSSLRADARQFRGFADFAPDSPEGRFYYRVVEALQMGVVTPILLWLLAERNAVPAAERAAALGALESWVVRRMLLRLTTKDINRLIVTLLKVLQASEPGRAGEITTRFLAEQTANSRYWPEDGDVLADLVGARLYGVVRQGRIRMVLEAIEDGNRTGKSEFPHCPRGLQVEHVMPQSWQPHWGDGITSDPAAVASRDRLVQTMGNLTLVTDKLNPSLANLPWGDEEAQAVKPGGQGKRSQLDEHSLLLLNRQVVKRNPERWTEEAIRARSRALAESIVRIWPRPATEQ